MRGMTIQVRENVQIGIDGFGMPIFEDKFVDVEDVLVGQPTTDDVTNTLSLYGKKAEFTLGIPKGDTHNWTDTEVKIPNPATGVVERYRTIGYPKTGIQANIPLRWGQNVMVERYG